MAFKQLYECELCGKTKYFFPEQAICAKCECEETNIDLSNTWCEATEENEKYLYENVSKNTHNLNKEKHFIIEKVQNKLDVRTINYVPNSNFKQIHLVNGKFEFVKSELETMKEKYKSGNYIAIYNAIGNNGSWYKTNIVGNCAENKYKLIHKKHTDILDVFLKDNSVKIEKAIAFDESNYNIDNNFIENYCEYDNYRIKEKQWYEIESNFPCIVMYEEKELVHMKSYKKYSKHRQEPCLLTSESEVYYSLSKCRPATKEEVLSLLIIL